VNDQVTDRDRILNKIKKCFNLSKSSEAHEAAAALRQAQKMMETHGVSQEELLGLEVKSIQIMTPEPYKKKLPLYMNVLMGICQRAFECNALIEPGYRNGKPRLCIRYFGINGKEQLAAYAHEVMWRQLTASWKQYQKDNPWAVNKKGARQGFWIGWLQEVRSKVMTFAGNEEEKDMLSRAMIAYNGGKELGTSKTNSVTIDGATHSAGSRAAGDFSIHRPINGAQQRRLS
jgi:hypothetical protein